MLLLALNSSNYQPRFVIERKMRLGSIIIREIECFPPAGAPQ